MLRDAGLTRTGLAVDRIVDIVEEVVAIEVGAPPVAGVCGRAVIEREITELLDVPWLLRNAPTAWAGQESPP